MMETHETESAMKYNYKKKEVLSKKQRGPQTNAKRWTDQDNNPCVAEANASYSCLHDTNFDRKSCHPYFVNYQNCQKFWLRVSRERQKHGIKPTLPPPEERDRILQDTR